MVPPDWQHPIDETDPTYHDGSTRYHSLFSGDLAALQREWDEQKDQWDRGFVRDYVHYPETRFKPREGDEGDSFEEYHGPRPDPADYMPQWEPEERTHYMMYETVTEGSPISPAFETPEELARWLADNDASAFAGDGASYEDWLATIRVGSTPGSCVIENGVIKSSVQFLGEESRGTRD